MKEHLQQLKLWLQRHVCMFVWHEKIGLKQCDECGKIRDIPEELISLQHRLGTLENVSTQ